MEKLKRLKVQGFRSLRDVDLELRDLTVLIGANGSGKSNLLSLLRLVHAAVSTDLQFRIATDGNASSVLHYGPKHTNEIRVDLEIGGGPESSEYGFTLSLAAPDRLIFAEERIRARPGPGEEPFAKLRSLNQLESTLASLAQVKETPHASTAREIVKVLGRVQAYHFHDTSRTAQVRLTQDVDRNRGLLADGANLASFLHMLRHVHPQHYQVILGNIRQVVPYLKDFELAPEKLNEKSILLRWRDRNPDYEFGAHQLSDGSLRAIALITALLQPEELMPSVFVIDEPELGLHPLAVSHIGSLIKALSSTRQVVVATQSPRILSQVEPEDVVVVEREEDERGFGSSTFRRLSAEGLARWRGEYDLGALFEMNVTGGAPQ